MKKIYILILTIAFSLAQLKSNAQYTIVKPDGFMEIGGYFLGYYNYRQYPSGTTNFKDNTFAVDYAVVDFNGVAKKLWVWNLKLNTVAFVIPGTDDGAIMEAYGAYNALNDALQIKFGYGKLPFDRSSMIETIETPYFERATMDKSSVYNRRDMGVTLRYSMWNKKINLYGGVYEGIGTNVLAQKNDATGSLEYLGRAEVSFPARYRNQEVDLVQLQVPVIAFGIDARYANKQTFTSITGDTTTVFNGQKFASSGNVDFLYKGFTAHLEYLRMKMTPRYTASADLYGKPTTYFMAGGVVASVNYLIKPIKTMIAVRYDQYNPNDVITGDTESTISYALNYMFDSQRAMIKVQYWQRLKDPNAQALWKPSELRIGFQLMF